MKENKYGYYLDVLTTKFQCLTIFSVEIIPHHLCMIHNYNSYQMFFVCSIHHNFEDNKPNKGSGHFQSN